MDVNVNHALIFVILIRYTIHSCSKVAPKAKSFSVLLKSKKVIKTPKVAQKLPSNLFRSNIEVYFLVEYIVWFIDIKSAFFSLYVA